MLCNLAELSLRGVVQVVGNTVKIRKTPGWLFGDIALLFGSVRSASVVAATDCTVWSLERKAFFQVLA